MKLSVVLMTVLVCSSLLIARQSEPVDLQMITRIKDEATNNSQVMETLSYLTDVYGPRLTGSSYLREASEWARDEMSEWGLANSRLESWGTFGRGWLVERYSIEMLSPRYMNLIAHPKAWTPGTDGPVTGEAVLIDLEDFDEESLKGTLSGKIVLLGLPEAPEKGFEADANRLSEEELEEKYAAPDGSPSPRNYSRWQRYRERRRKREQISKFLRQENVAAVMQASSITHGTLRIQSGGSYKNAASNTLPTLVVALEHYNRIARLLEKEIPVEMAVNIQTRFETEDSLGYNVIAEIPGTDRKLKDEVVVIGAHIDSWHSGTGATDNAGGCAVMMEVMRILKALDIAPRRTIRVALWSGEEQRLFGSRGYVKQEYGNRRTMELKEDHENLAAYYNIDNGSGKIRGIYLQGNDACRPIFESWFRPFHDMGAETITIRGTRSTDHMAFDELGLPGFQFIQDPLDYFSRTWHTNMDVYDHVLEGDLIQMSTIVASIVYHTAMRDEKLPRKPLPQGDE